MTHTIIENPIINSPFTEPEHHFCFSDEGITDEIVAGRRRSSYFIPIASPKKKGKQIAFDTEWTRDRIEENKLVNDIRGRVGQWRMGGHVGITAETRRLLAYWTNPEREKKLFFCQIEALETAIYITEVAKKYGDAWIDNALRKANDTANPGLPRMAFKMATGSGKTVVMAMLIAWQTLNKLANPQDARFTDTFLFITPGITIRDRLRVLLPNDPHNYYRQRDIISAVSIERLQRAKILITNFHAFQQREKVAAGKLTKSILADGKSSPFTETPDEMVRRVCRELGGKKHVIVINDEAHHCYHRKPDADGEKLTGDERREAKKRDEEGRVWISGIEAVRAKIGVKAIYDLSATPFFLRGSGWPEGTLFPWVVSDFSLIDSIEAGIVKVPRVPVADNSMLGEQPTYRDLWLRIRDGLPKKGRKTDAVSGDPKLPAELEGALSIFRNDDGHGGWLHRPNTILVDSEQLESGEAMSKEFKQAAAREIDEFKAEYRLRFPGRDADKLTDEDLLREVMNTVGKAGRLGEQVKCVVSVSMLTEGWDANTVTHVLGVRAFGTQLLCEQVVGRALRRMSYAVNGEGRFNAEYAEVYGVPFSFIPTSGSNPNPEPGPIPTRVRALEDRIASEITFPRLAGYRYDIPGEKLMVTFTEDSKLAISTADIPTRVQLDPIVGETSIHTLDDLKRRRENEVAFLLAKLTLEKYFRDDEGNAKPWLFPQLLTIARRWLAECVTLKDNTFPQLLLLIEFAHDAADRIYKTIVQSQPGTPALKPILQPYDTLGSTRYVDFDTTRPVYATCSDKCHISHVVADTGSWEQKMAETLEERDEVLRYVKNHNLGFTIPYTLNGEEHQYTPDFIAMLDDGHGADNLLNLIIEVTGEKRKDKAAKTSTARTLWVPTINNHGGFGRWEFIEIADPWDGQNAIRHLLAHNSKADDKGQEL